MPTTSPKPGPDSPVSTYGANNTDVSAAIGEQFAIELDSNASTGYSWSYKSSSDSVRLVSDDYKGQSDAIGAGGKQVFTFEATQAGTTELVFVYSRSTPSADDSTVKYTVTIH